MLDGRQREPENTISMELNKAVATRMERRRQFGGIILQSRITRIWIRIKNREESKMIPRFLIWMTEFMAGLSLRWGKFRRGAHTDWRGL